MAFQASEARQPFMRVRTSKHKVQCSGHGVVPKTAARLRRTTARNFRHPLAGNSTFILLL